MQGSSAYLLSMLLAPQCTKTKIQNAQVPHLSLELPNATRLEKILEQTAKVQEVKQEQGRVHFLFFVSFIHHGAFLKEPLYHHKIFGP